MACVTGRVAKGGGGGASLIRPITISPTYSHRIACRYLYRSPLEAGQNCVRPPSSRWQEGEVPSNGVGHTQSHADLDAQRIIDRGILSKLTHTSSLTAAGTAIWQDLHGLMNSMSILRTPVVREKKSGIKPSPESSLSVIVQSMPTRHCLPDISLSGLFKFSLLTLSFSRTLDMLPHD